MEAGHWCWLWCQLVFCVFHTSTTCPHHVHTCVCLLCGVTSTQTYTQVVIMSWCQPHCHCQQWLNLRTQCCLLNAAPNSHLLTPWCKAPLQTLGGSPWPLVQWSCGIYLGCVVCFFCCPTLQGPLENTWHPLDQWPVLISRLSLQGGNWKFKIHSRPRVVSSLHCIVGESLHFWGHDTTRHDTTRHDTTRHDTTRHDTTRHDTTQHNTGCTLKWSSVNIIISMEYVTLDLMVVF